MANYIIILIIKNINVLNVIYIDMYIILFFALIFKFIHKKYLEQEKKKTSTNSYIFFSILLF